MSLRDLTKDKHAEAETTAFMKAVFAKTLPLETWADFTYNKMIFYGAIEAKARAEGFMDDLNGIDRAYWLYEDYKSMGIPASVSPATAEYRQYILDLAPGLVLAHLYTWHMGDLHGGQMIRKIIDAPHRSLEFEDRVGLINRLRVKLDDSLAEEANVAFDWAIRIMKEYDDYNI